ncbi:hypothetical protein NMY22_g15510 [Coprinellus aureogranulatus]|nr:hypothetical protein NMY22_g15510 [Coprinellus aureogranulatus]
MHSTIKTHIFLTGATGYIGGSVLTRLLSHPRSETFRITVLVRAPEKATQFRKMGIQAVVGTYEDLDLLKQHASKSDIVIQCSDADGLKAAKAILAGLKDRFEETGRAPALIHTVRTPPISAEGLTSDYGAPRNYSLELMLKDDAHGMFASDTVYSDLDSAKLDSIPRSQPHREVDLTLVDADKQGYVRTYIILPTLVYGKAIGPLVDAGLQNSRSRHIPQLVEAALSRGRAGFFGKGANIWCHVHIMDLASLYVLLVDAIAPHDGLESRARSRQASDNDEPPSRPRTPVIRDASYLTHGEQGFYFAENGEVSILQVAEAIGHAMVDAGQATDPNPSPFTDEEIRKCFGDDGAECLYLDCNSRCKADRARRLGWKPKKTTKDLLGSIKQELKSSSQGE